MLQAQPLQASSINTDLTEEARERLIEVQKERAIYYWNTSNLNDDLKMSVNEDVISKLKQGLVPPIFHTLCRPPEKRLFAPLTRVYVDDDDTFDNVQNPSAKVDPSTPDNEYDYKLSTEPVTTGAPPVLLNDTIRLDEQLTEVNVDNETFGDIHNPSDEVDPRTPDNKYDSVYIKLSTEPVTAGAVPVLLNNTIGEISSDDDTSYMTAFFTLNGTPHLRVNDFFSKPWTFNVRYTKQVAALVNAPAKMVGEDIEVTELLSTFLVDNKNGTNLITRRLSRGVVGDCFELSEYETDYAIVGSPGIGKSWTLIYALQQALLYVNACVIFYFAKRGRAMACIRRGNEVFVWTVRSKSFESYLFENSSVLLLHDPKEAKTGGTKLLDGRRRLIIAVSNNKKHFANNDKTTGLFQRTLSKYSKDELKAAICYMNSDVGIAGALERSNVVGLLPRYLISKSIYMSCLLRTQEAIDDFHQEQFHKMLAWKGMVSDKTRDTIAGCIFSIYADVIARSLENDDDDDDATLDVGYDGQIGINYSKCKISIISTYVFQQLIAVKRDHILTYWAKFGSGELSCMGKAVEDLFWDDLQNKDIYIRSFKMKNSKCTTRNNECNVVEDKIPCEKLDLQYKHVIENLDIEDLRTEIFSTNDTLCRMKTGGALIDFAGPGKNVYQVTVSENHSLSISGLYALFCASGHIAKDKSGKDKVQEKIGTINFYWVVPYGLEKKLKGRVARYIKEDKKDDDTKSLTKKLMKKLVKNCLEKYVIQYILVMDKKGRLKSEDKSNEIKIDD
jgi:hypothetical protein